MKKGIHTVIIFKISEAFNSFLRALGLVRPTYYINGPETLPEPLSAEEEQELLSAPCKQSREKTDCS